MVAVGVAQWQRVVLPKRGRVDRVGSWHLLLYALK